MSKIDSFTAARLRRFVDQHRMRSAQLPTLRDLEEAGFPKATIESAVAGDVLVELYVTMTSGAVVKGYKVKA